MIDQPVLYVPPDIERGLLEGTLKLFGSVVREADSGRIHKHLNELRPRPEKAGEAVKGMQLNANIVITFVAVVAMVGGGVAYFARKRKTSQLRSAEHLPKCITDFGSSLRAYVEAGRDGALDAHMVEALLEDLDAIKAFSDEGDEVKISLDDLVPLFDLVIAHTRRLADAYSVPVENFEEPADSQDGVVVELRRHLEVQKAILTQAS